MNITPLNSIRRLVCAGALALVAAGMASCGGGDGGVGSGGTGAPASGYGSGTLTGFGSLVLDGFVYAHDQDSAVVELEPGSLTQAAPRLGQSAQLEYDIANGQVRALSVRLTPVLRGAVDSVDGANGEFTSLGQHILINESPDVGPVTFFVGLRDLADLSPDDPVEVHGVPRYNAALSRYELQATRVERLSDLPANPSILGIVQADAAISNGRQFRIGSLTVAYQPTNVEPAQVPLQNGDRVIVWLNERPATLQAEAQGVRVLLPATAREGVEARMGGTVGSFDAANRSFDLGGVRIGYGNAVVTPQGPGFTLANNAYVLVDGSFDSDGALVARHVRVRKRTAIDFVEVELSGSIESFGGPGSFQVRGTPVDAQTAPLSGCGATVLQTGLQVRIEGSIESGSSGSRVKAASIRCLRP